MFDISFPEIMLCLVVALVVLGPERLPVVVRTLGRWTGMAKTYMRNLSAELERETQMTELRKQLDDAKRALSEHANSGEQATRKAIEDVSSDIKKP
ncbi:MAG TPA: Sec-independent protein translocase protein TatB [Stenotrophobium sp.]|jgi:sec-independent protein translocase protein TatB|nr:Sec-independent protein translocase protein TatB [Stenotrophobium sp.]